MIVYGIHWLQSFLDHNRRVHDMPIIRARVKQFGQDNNKTSPNSHFFVGVVWLPIHVMDGLCHCFAHMISNIITLSIYIINTYVCMYVYTYTVYQHMFQHSNPSKSPKPTLAPQPLHLSAASALDRTSLGERCERFVKLEANSSQSPTNRLYSNVYSSYIMLYQVTSDVDESLSYI